MIFASKFLDNFLNKINQNSYRIILILKITNKFKIQLID